MNITVQQAQGKVPVTILGIQGEVDASNYQDLIARAQELYQKGSRHLLLDLGQVSYLSSSGLVALHGIALLLSGRQLPDPEHGWATLRSVTQAPGTGVSPYIKLLNPQPKVERVLQTSGLKDYMECYTDLATAVASF